MKIKHAIIACSVILTSLGSHYVSAQTVAKKISIAEAKKNQLADDEFLRALQTGDVSKLGDIADAGFINHGVGEKIGPDSLKASIKMFHSRFKPKVEVISRTTDGEYFGNWVRFIGANPGVAIEGIEMTKYANGKALEHWFFPNNQRRTN
jgi:hypothetical protein